MAETTANDMYKRLGEHANGIAARSFDRPSASGSSLVALAVVGAAASASAGNVFEGRSVYESHCLQCHGTDGNAVLPNAPNFMRGERLNQPDSVLLQSIRDGKAVMPAFDKILGREDLLNVISYIRTLRKF